MLNWEILSAYPLSIGSYQLLKTYVSTIEERRLPNAFTKSLEMATVPGNVEALNCRFLKVEQYLVVKLLTNVYLKIYMLNWFLTWLFLYIEKSGLFFFKQNISDRGKTPRQFKYLIHMFSCIQEHKFSCYWTKPLFKNTAT